MDLLTSDPFSPLHFLAWDNHHSSPWFYEAGCFISHVTGLTYDFTSYFIHHRPFRSLVASLLLYLYFASVFLVYIRVHLTCSTGLSSLLVGSHEITSRNVSLHLSCRYKVFWLCHCVDIFFLYKTSSTTTISTNKGYPKYKNVAETTSIYYYEQTQRALKEQGLPQKMLLFASPCVFWFCLCTMTVGSGQTSLPLFCTESFVELSKQAGLFSIPEMLWY